MRGFLMFGIRYCMAEWAGMAFGRFFLFIFIFLCFFLVSICILALRVLVPDIALEMLLMVWIWFSVVSKVGIALPTRQRSTDNLTSLIKPT